MPSFNTILVRDQSDVNRRLADFGLFSEQILSIAETAHSRELDASPLMPVNAPGLLKYIYGVETLRSELLDDEEWSMARINGVEVVINRQLKVRIGYHNVDKACDPLFPPHPRSSKGKTSEKMSGPTLFEYYGVETGPVQELKENGMTTFYVMVGEDGSVELSNPIIEDGRYIAFAERIFVHSPKDINWEVDNEPETGPIDDFEVKVTLKSEM